MLAQFLVLLVCNLFRLCSVEAMRALRRTQDIEFEAGRTQDQLRRHVREAEERERREEEQEHAAREAQRRQDLATLASLKAAAARLPPGTEGHAPSALGSSADLHRTPTLKLSTISSSCGVSEYGCRCEFRPSASLA